MSTIHFIIFSEDEKTVVKSATVIDDQFNYALCEGEEFQFADEYVCEIIKVRTKLIPQVRMDSEGRLVQFGKFEITYEVGAVIKRDLNAERYVK